MAEGVSAMPGVAGPRRRARADFFSRPQTWSRRKHRLLGKYLGPFAAKLGQHNRTVFVIDGFAGKGKYDDSTAGSPLVTASVADVCYRFTDPVWVRIINVEKKRNHFAALCKNTARWVDDGVVENLHGSFGEVVDDIMRRIGCCPAFFFVDPFGPTDIPLRDLEPVLARRDAATELIINFDADGLRRLADASRIRPGSAQAAYNATLNAQYVSDILGTDAWEPALYGAPQTSAEREGRLVELYADRIRQHRFAVLKYPIRPRIGDRPKYYLVYCTRHMDGVLLMSNFVREEEDELVRESLTTSGPQLQLVGEGFDPVEAEIVQRRRVLRLEITRHLEHTGTTTRGQLRQTLAMDHFGEFRDTDINVVLRELVTSGVARTQHGRQRFNDGEPITYIGDVNVVGTLPI